MPAENSFDYAVIRVVPRVDRGEFFNAGVILFSRTRRYLNAAIALDRARLLALAPWIDVEEVERALESIVLICRGDARAGPIAQLDLAGRFHWLTSPRSTVVQTSPVHTGICTEPDALLQHLLETMVLPSEPPPLPSETS